MSVSKAEWIYVGLRALGIVGFVVFVIFYPLSSPASYDSSPSSTTTSQPIAGPYGTICVVLNSSKPIPSGDHVQGNVTLPNYKTSSLQIPDCSQPLPSYSSAPVPSLFVTTSDQHSHWATQTPMTDPKDYVMLQRCFGYDSLTQTMWFTYDFNAQTDTYYWFVVSLPTGYSSRPTGTYGASSYVAPLYPRLNANIVNPPKINWPNVAGWMMGIAAVAAVVVDISQRLSHWKKAQPSGSDDDLGYTTGA